MSNLLVNFLIPINFCEPWLEARQIWIYSPCLYFEFARQVVEIKNELHEIHAKILYLGKA